NCFAVVIRIVYALGTLILPP
ncbi:hypothetical protein VN97_g9645, partial [Penicillium thymicola]